MADALDTLRLCIPSSLGGPRASRVARSLSRFFEVQMRLAVRVEVDVVGSYAELERRALAGDAPVAWAPPIVAARLELHGGRPLLRFVRRGVASYCSALLTAPGVSLEAGAGLKVAWVDRDSTAGYLLPRAFLRERGEDPDAPFSEQRFLGSYDEALAELLAGRVDVAAAYASRARDGTLAIGALQGLSDDERARCEVVAVTPEVPSDGLVLAPGVRAEVGDALSRDLGALERTPRGREVLREAFDADGVEAAEPGSYSALYSLVLSSFGLKERARACPSCSARVSLNARFCERCGAPLSTTDAHRRPHASPQWQEERKLATVLFADLAGFTKISSQLEPDQVRDFANACLGPLSAEVERRGGTVVKYLGDALMAVFGVPRGDEKDAQRAVRAGLAMCRIVKDISKEMESRYGAPIGVRVGINSGLVMVGTVGGARPAPDVMGGTVNLASRIEGAARPGEVLVGQATWQLCGDDFEVEALGGMEFKGLSEPTTVFRVLGERKGAHDGASTRALDVSFAVRQRELRELQAIFDETCVLSWVKAVKVIGDPGLGKTWLLGAFKESLRSHPHAPEVLEAIASLPPGGSQTPLRLLGEMLRGRFGVDPGEDVAAVRARIDAGVRAAFASPDDDEAAEVAGLLTDVAVQSIEMDSGSRLARTLAVLREERILRAFASWISQLAKRSPVCFLLRELQWADSASLDVIERLFLSAGRLPILLVLSARPELDDRWLRRADASGRLERIELRPLPRETMSIFLDNVLAPLEGAPSALKEAILKRAEGSPACAKELVRLLVDQGAIVVGEGGAPWRWVKERFGSVELPATVHGVLQARLDRLTVEEKEVLKRASVLGRTVRRGALEALTSAAAGEADGVGRTLDALTRKGLLDRGDDDVYVFRTQALRDIAYRSLPAGQRKRLHRAAADWILAHTELWERGRAEIAGHLEAAGDVDEAAGHYLAAARQAADVEANPEAALFYDKALAARCAGDDARSYAAALRESALVMARVGRFDDALARLDEAAAQYALPSAGASATDGAGLELERAGVLKERGRTDEALAALDRGLALGAEVPLLLRMLLYAERAFLRGARGEHATANDDCQEGMRLGDLEEERGREWALAMAKLHDTQALVHLRGGDLQAAEQAFREALAMREESGDRRGQLVALINLGGLAFSRGEFALAVTRFQEALKAAESAKRVKDIALCANNLGQAELAVGDVEGALSHLEQARRMAEENELLDVLADSARALSDARLQGGDSESALDEALRALVYAERGGAIPFKIAAHVSALNALLARADAGPGTATCDAAHGHLRAAVVMLRASGNAADLARADELTSRVTACCGPVPDMTRGDAP